MKRRTPVLVNILTVIGLLVILYYMFVQDYSFFSSPYFWGTAVIASILTFIHSAIGDLIENNKFKKLSPEEKQAYIAQKKVPYFKYLYDGAFKKQSATEEKDIIIDHGFDGIMELDNQLPKWWLGLFWFGTAFCVVYLVAFSFTDFADPISEYDKEYKEQLASIAEYEEKQPPITIETAAFSEDNIADGEAIFKANCVTCHGDGGKGISGPNLTDKFWKNQRQPALFKNVFDIVANGVQGTAMQGWGVNGVISTKEIQQVSAYVYYINQQQDPITVEQGGLEPYGTEANWQE